MSPTLFNLFLNDLLEQLEAEGFDYLAYADDVIVAVNSLTLVKRAAKIIGDWSYSNKIKINPEKSGIMRILK